MRTGDESERQCGIGQDGRLSTDDRGAEPGFDLNPIEQGLATIKHEAKHKIRRRMRIRAYVAPSEVVWLGRA